MFDIGSWKLLQNESIYVRDAHKKVIEDQTRLDQSSINKSKQGNRIAINTKNDN